LAPAATIIVPVRLAQPVVRWRAIVIQYSVIGASVHDARLVAGMKVHAINRILTFDVDRFSRYAGIQIIHPKAV
jgi:predicted nucleic acid-binding protein